MDTHLRAVLDAARRNRLLAALPENDLKRLAPELDPVEVPLRSAIIRADTPFPDVYFPLDCVVSLTGAPSGERTVEIATIGNEGMAGVFAYLGGRTMPFDAWVQVSGQALRMRVPALQSEVARCAALDEILRRYVKALFTQVAQGVMCNRLHGMDARAAKWLLLTHDRAGRDTFEMTQEFLAYLLGVRRATAALTLGALEREGHLSRRRGEVSVVDRAGLEEKSCSCYAVVRDCYERMLEGYDPDT